MTQHTDIQLRIWRMSTCSPSPTLPSESLIVNSLVVVVVVSYTRTHMCNKLIVESHMRVS